MAWIETEDGYVNLETAQRIVRDKYFIVDQGGESHQLVIGDMRLDELLASVVPGSGVLHRILYDPAGPGEPQTIVETYPIVAWRVTCDAAQPVVPGVNLTDLLTMSSEIMTVIEMPDGSLAEFPGKDRYESIELAQEALVGREQMASGKR